MWKYCADTVTFVSRVLVTVFTLSTIMNLAFIHKPYFMCWFFPWWCSFWFLLLPLPFHWLLFTCPCEPLKWSSSHTFIFEFPFQDFCLFALPLQHYTLKGISCDYFQFVLSSRQTRTQVYYLKIPFWLVISLQYFLHNHQWMVGNSLWFQLS